MIHLRRITGNSRNYVIALPAESCRHQDIRPGSFVTLQVVLGDQPARFPTRVLRHGRGLKVTIPRPWRLGEGLTPGDSVVLLEAEPRVFELRILPGGSEKELQRRMEVLMRRRIEQARADLRAAYRAGFHEGYFRRANERIGILMRDRMCFNPKHD